jgi:hypothetical protein
MVQKAKDTFKMPPLFNPNPNVLNVEEPKEEEETNVDDGNTKRVVINIKPEQPPPE